MDSNQYKINKVNAYNSWDPLKQVVLGNVYEPEFFETVGDPKLRDLLQQILYETHEDLTNIRKTLEDLGVEVIQPPRNTMDGVPEEDMFDTIQDAMEVFLLVQILLIHIKLILIL
jgi:aspartate/glutamate racemase